jgi:ABC-2 type transport system ATP-binding protein
MNRETLVSVERISRYYGEQCAINDISFSVKRGEVLGFLGPNGAGKSTTMQIICGVLAASNGSVSIAGHDIINEAKKAKQHLGFLPEQPPLYTDLTVDEYLKYCARLRQIPASRLSKAVGESKLRCGLHEAGHHLIANLSKGYQQRVGIAQAIIHSPAVVVLDEPTSGLDPIQIVEIRGLISELGEDHSVVLSTHILSEVQSCCSRVMIINKGKLVLDEDIHALQETSEYACCNVAMHNPPVPEELEKLEGINRVETIDPYRQTDIPCLLTDSASANGWGIFELIPQHDLLEQTFMRLTSDNIHSTSNTSS